jgi:hypothetical protein
MSIFNSTKVSVVFVLITLLVFTPCLASAQDLEQEISKSTVGNTFIDAAIYRPVGLIAIPVGAVLFVITIPFSAISSSVGTSFEKLVAHPAKYTFVRPLGDI